MLTKLSQPTNPQVYQQEAPMARIALTGAVLFAFLSWATESLGGYLYFESTFHFIGHPILRVLAAGALAALVAIALELIIWEGTAYVTNNLLFRKFQRLEVARTALVGAALVFMVSYSVFVSKRAARLSLQQLAPAPALLDHTAVEQEYKAQDTYEAGQYQAARREIIGRYGKLEAQEREHYASLMHQKDVKIADYREREQRTGQSFVSGIKRLEAEKAALQTELTATLRKLTQKQEQELAALLTTRTERGEILFAKADTLLSSVMAQNQAKIASAAAWSATFSAVISNLAGFAVVLSVVLHIFIVIFYKESGMTVEVVSMDEDFEPSFLSEIRTWAELAVMRRARNAVRRGISRSNELMDLPHSVLAAKLRTMLEQAALPSVAPVQAPAPTAPEMTPVNFPPLEMGSREWRAVYDAIYGPTPVFRESEEAPEKPPRSAASPAREAAQPAPVAPTPANGGAPARGHASPPDVHVVDGGEITIILTEGKRKVEHTNRYGTTSYFDVDQVESSLPNYEKRMNEKWQEYLELLNEYEATGEPKTEKRMKRKYDSYLTNKENFALFTKYKEMLRGK